ncbi:endonuclease III [candidate division KSB1 bacterium]|nr:endonuclease III [candidate division KSB1 bacterium]
MSEQPSLSKRVGKIVLALEERFGVPENKKKRDPLDSFVLTMLSQSTSDHNRDLAYNRLKARFASWEEVCDADPKEIADAIRPGGLANQKSVRIKAFLAWIQESYGELNLDFLCKMQSEEAIDIFTKRKGIGIKTISVVLLFSCDKEIFPVDTHVHRICKRLGLVSANATAEKTHWEMQPLVPDGKALSLHINLLRLGRSLCRSRNPKCVECPLHDDCDYIKSLSSG